MKKLGSLIILCSMFFCGGCVVQKASMWVGVADYSRYNNSGFVVSPIAEGYVYTPIATITVTVEPGVRSDTKWWAPDYDYMLSQLVTVAMQRGATGLLNVSITRDVISSHYDYRYKAEGFAVIIHDKKEDNRTAADSTAVVL